MQAGPVTTLFLDIGGVLLTNGWGRSSRKLAAEHFKLDLVELNERHHLTFDTYEIGKISLDEYLERIVFYEKRDFSIDDFKTFMYGQTQPYTDSIEFFKQLKQRHGLKVIAVNNEGRELNDYRIHQFRLYELFDAYASSCYVKFRKPDIDIFRIACDIGRVAPQQAAMVDDRQMFTNVASTLGINCLHFDSLAGIKEKMKTLNLQNG
ncbi:MAG: HAD family phosphatase [Chitinophagaceae bacterium]|nr:HAD hydrolase-like protein [Sphingobacteriales bacterium]OJW03766.1 MAG: hydrolase [Sphingobacteriales bacterium 44-61]TXJ23707.1 MAG: HAD family phosphatase [Chitinophagaceae bacterium]